MFLSPAPSPFILSLIDIIWKAGRLIKDMQNAGFSARHKPDGSPVTDVDFSVENFILGELHSLTSDIPIISEEKGLVGQVSDFSSSQFFLVDPLDGTSAFMLKSKEFTVNIALIEAGIPVLGLIFAPALDRLFLGDVHLGAFEMIPSHADDATALFRSGKQLPYATDSNVPLIALCSKNHSTLKEMEILDYLGIEKIVAMSSSLKFCELASGRADIYPRCSTTMEWDIAAGQAILEAAGGCLLGSEITPPRYGKFSEGLKNHHFIACSNRLISSCDLFSALLPFLSPEKIPLKS